MAKLVVKTQRDRVEAAQAAFRFERNRRLAESDWIVVRAHERGEPIPEAWAAYRQALRDLPSLLNDEQILSGAIPWPSMPD